MMTVRVDANVRDISRSLDRLAKEQLPFAMAQAVNATADKLKAAEQQNMRHVLDRPTPFTLNAIGVRKARKGNPVATLYVKPVAASYLEPYEYGGVNKLNGRALLKPVGLGVNQYGNLPRNAIQRLLSNPDVFVGPVTFRKSGQTINGVWLRPNYGKRRRNGTAIKRGTKGNTQNMVAGARTGLRLLIHFEDAHPVTQRLGFNDVARRTVPASFDRELRIAIAKAVATAR